MNDELYQSIVNAPSMNPKERGDLARLRLKELVTFAKESSPFYRDLYRNIDPENFTLADLPVIDKKLVMAHFGDIFTDSSLRTDEIFAFVNDPANIGKSFHERYTVVTTSGTSGNPFAVVRDSHHNEIHGLMLSKRFLRGLDPAFMTPVKSRIAVVIASESPCSSYSSFIRMKKAFSGCEQNTRAFAITAPIADIVSGLNEFQPDILTGYPSIMLILAQRQLTGELAVTPKVLACSAETLTEKVYHQLKHAFPGAAVLNNYCSTEGGEIAMSCSCGRLHLNDDWLILEGVDEHLEPTAPGAISSGVLVTDLSNRVMPIIRYRLEDRIQFSPEPCSCGSTLPVVTVWGRGADTLVFHGVEIPSVFFAVTMYEQADILSWQFAQTSEETLEFRAVYPDAAREKSRAWIKERFTRFLADHACSDVALVLSDAPPKNSERGGKLKQVVKEC